MKCTLSGILLASLPPRRNHALQTEHIFRGYSSKRHLEARHVASSAILYTSTTTSKNEGSTNMPNVCRILCYGDSLTAGTSASSPFELYPYAPHLESSLNHLATSAAVVAGEVDDTSHIDLTTTYVVRHRGMPGWTADAMTAAADDPQYGLRSAIQGIQNPSLSCVIILAGTNDLGYAVGSAFQERDQQVSTITTPIKALHEMAWREGVPRTIAVSVPPSGYQAQVAEASLLAMAVNQELKAFCEASEGRGLFVSFPFDYEVGGENWSPDSLHFSPKGYQVLGEYLVDPVKKVLEGDK